MASTRKYYVCNEPINFSKEDEIYNIKYTS